MADDSKIIMKRGGSFDFSGSVNLTNAELGTLHDFTGWSGESHIRKPSGELVSDLDFEWTVQSVGQLRIHAADTSEWPFGCLEWDVRFTSPDGQIIHTDTLLVEVKRSATQ